MTTVSCGSRRAGCAARTTSSTPASCTAAGPFVPGHETVGIVEAIGAAAAERWGVQPGDRVAVQVFQSCRGLRRLPPGRPPALRAARVGDDVRVPGHRGPTGPVGRLRHAPCTSGPTRMLLPVPDGLDPVLATAVQPARGGHPVGGHAARHHSRAIGWRCSGPGIRGLSVCAAAKDAGAEFVMVTGAGRARPPPPRGGRALRRRSGGRRAPRRTRSPRFRRATGSGGADVVVDVTANAPAAFAQGRGPRPRAEAPSSSPARAAEPTPGFHADHIVYKELRILGALGVDTDAYRAAIDLLASHRYPFADAQPAAR